VSTVVWDGKTLASDRQATNGNLSRTMTKIYKHGDILIAMTGIQTSGQAVVNWVLDGCEPDKFPKDWVHPDSQVWVINRNGTVAKFEDAPFPLVSRDKFFAEGSGRDFAYGALEMGADAVTAVKVACVYDIYSGGGIDTLSFDE
jgi:20S proteasome alpha/beta subunit